MTVLAHIGGGWLDDLPGEVPGVRVRHLPPGEPAPEDVRGEVLLTLATGADQLAEHLEHGVRWVHTLGTGVDRFPLDLIGDRVLTCSRGASAEPIGEWIAAVVLAATKDLPAAWVTEPPERWSHNGRIGTLRGTRVAVLGLGSIGREAARLLRAFGAEVVGTRRRVAEPSGVDGVRVVADPVEAVTGAAHVVVAAPSTPETRHLVDAKLLAAMPEGVHLVNIARGALVDQEALREALDSGHVGLASLDTVEPEPLPAGHWMYEHPRVRLSPHVSWESPGALEVLREVFVANLKRYVAGEPLEGVVDVEAGY